MHVCYVQVNGCGGLSTENFWFIVVQNFLWLGINCLDSSIAAVIQYLSSTDSALGILLKVTFEQ